MEKSRARPHTESNFIYRVAGLRPPRAAAFAVLSAGALSSGCAAIMGFEEGHPFPPDAGGDGSGSSGSDGGALPEVSTPGDGGPVDGGPCSLSRPNTDELCRQHAPVLQFDEPLGERSERALWRRL